MKQDKQNDYWYNKGFSQGFISAVIVFLVLGLAVGAVVYFTTIK